MSSIDTLINARWVIPVEPDATVFEQHAVAIHEGDIIEVLPQATAGNKYTARHTVDLPHHALIPGLINTHTHASMTLFRGLADDLPLMEWLGKHIWPAEGRWVGPEFVYEGTELAIAEMLKSGTTCFNDMYFFPQEAAHACQKARIRAVIGMIMIDFPSTYAQDSDEYLSKGLALHDGLRSNSLITTAFAPHAPYTVADGPLQQIHTLADELDVPIHMHVHETAHEIEEALKQIGKRPLQRLDELGLLNPRLLAVHMTQLTEAEIKLAEGNGIHVLHCPESNLKLASGFCQVAELLQAGINVAIGTDGAASNNDLDMLGEMRTAALLAKGVSGDATALPARTVLRMATINGARALGLDQQIGSITPGKAADLAAIDLSQLNSQPVFDPVSQIVYSAGREQVTDVWVAGHRLLHQRTLTTLDENTVLAQAAQWHDRISATDPTGDQS